MVPMTVCTTYMCSQPLTTHAVLLLDIVWRSGEVSCRLAAKHVESLASLWRLAGKAGYKSAKF